MQASRGFRSVAAVSVLGVLCALAVQPAAGAEWPQWLGPDRDNSTSEKVAAWKTPPTVVWKKPVGDGNSAPLIVGGKVYLHTAVAGKDEEEIAAYDAATGKPAWSYKYPRVKFTTLFGNGPRATPAIVDGKLYAHGLTGVLTCLDAATGEKVWQVDTWDKFIGNEDDVKAPFGKPGGKRRPFFGVACSPLVEGNLVVVNVGGKDSSVVAFDRAKGDVVWKALDDHASYSSPITRGKGASREIVLLTGENVVGLEPAKGKVAWKYPLVDNLAESATTPVQVGELLFATSVTFGGVALKADGKEAWKGDKYNSYFATPVAVGTDQMYLVTCTKPSLVPQRMMATLRCVDAATGKERWSRDKVGKYHASLMRVGGDKLLMLEEEGDLVLIDPSTKEYKELARAKVCGNTWAHPALVGGKLYVRDNKELICLQLGE
jgi:outer membrane protein assembly factor BamB